MDPPSQKQSRKAPSESENGPPRKRRKRTVISGAPDDCFTCARQGTKCDRRRPYCSQCLDQGRECAGYKTTLTWGVGVASRGKFRGLSLPVTGSQPATNAPKSSHPAGSRRQSNPARPTLSPSPDTSSPIATPTPSSLQRDQKQWPSLTGNAIGDKTRTISPSAAHAWPNASGPCSSESQSWTQVPDHQVGAPPDIIGALNLSAVMARQIQPAEVALQCPSAAYSPEHQGAREEHDDHEDHGEQRRCDSPSWVKACPSLSFSQLLLARSVGRTPRLQYLISYYAEVIAPMIVAFDRPTNPFRMHILRLAQESTSLQEAIATLSTSNIRQRRERRMMSTERTLPARMSSLAHRALTDGALGDSYGISTPAGFVQEEQYHRCMAVKELNKELADPHQRLSDSVLATLLILCLFHVCDTGVAQFKTQFAGVTKLLAIRMRASPLMSEELKWFIRMFTWYDTMTATTNDREVQLRGTCLDITTVSDGEWGLENLAGCDPGLFKLIAQLGRLNMLSQDQEAHAPALPDIFASSTTLPPSMVYHPSDPSVLSTCRATEPYLFPFPCPIRTNEHTRRPLSPTFWAEWFSYRQKLESWRLPSYCGGSHGPFESSIQCTPTMTQAYMSPPSSPCANSAVAPENMEDVYHTSEAFRHAAILYTERLAYPDVASHTPRIQHIVHRTMQHILAVKSDVYLLWPLFIIGSECVLKSHRTVIQQRCRDIAKDSGFLNNLSCLELLEKIWADSPVLSETGDHSTSTGPLGSVLSAPTTSELRPVPVEPGFRWHRVMQARQADGEYMVV
ncbi:hypothetical protein EYZ11_001054 [Aspergillus tanneri]|uniref:Zn(2)-C6 fungal-type domain-containing protein n=1 Tax=Aspergillus tanneri TaxID=1220188 RepID=A0A4S3JVQ7_9EURO|nr:uncharacterized protein ATNIH1004_001577 [Aspergillus tanneri]KAA8652672.1 hypothetical protein ATNIH1004_001577 [Aspergillus tanneri]THC99505.1 hypothetical protein EYZ11_001054 [Aspergillus tanneri]